MRLPAIGPDNQVAVLHHAPLEPGEPPLPETRVAISVVSRDDDVLRSWSTSIATATDALIVLEKDFEVSQWQPLQAPSSVWKTGVFEQHYTQSFAWNDRDVRVDFALLDGAPSISLSNLDGSRQAPPVDPTRWLAERGCHVDWKAHALVIDFVALDPQSGTAVITFVEAPGYPPLPCDASALAHVVELPRL